MISPSIFKAYDIRGRYPREINERVVFEISRKLGEFFKSKVRDGRLRIIIGRDARLSSPSLYKAVLKGLRGQGLGFRKTRKKKLNLIPHTLYPAGMATTPMLYFLVNHFKADGGIMITASHNPKEYNGLKAVGLKAQPISGKEIYKIILNREL